MAHDDDTPNDRRLVLLRRRAERERLLRRLRDEVEPPDYAHERDSEPSYRMALSEPGQRLSVEGDDPAALAELVERVRHKPTLLQRGIESVAPITDRMTSPRGKLVGKVSLGITGLVGLLTALQQAISWMREQGLLD